MIRISTDPYRKFIYFLNERYPSKTDVEFGVMPGLYILEDRDDESFKGYGGYDYEKQVILVAGDLEGIRNHCLEAYGKQLSDDELRYEMLHTIGHEYYHHLQHEAGGEQNEDEADDFGEKMAKEYISENKD